MIMDLFVIMKNWIPFDPITPDIYSAVIGVILGLSVTVSISMAIADNQNKKTYFGSKISGTLSNLLFHILTWIVLITFLIIGTFYIFPFHVQLIFSIISAALAITSILLNSIAKKILAPVFLFRQKKLFCKYLLISNKNLTVKQIEKKSIIQSKIFEKISNCNDCEDIWRMYKKIMTINKNTPVRKSVIIELEDKISSSMQYYINFIKLDIKLIETQSLLFLVQSSINNFSLYSISSLNVNFLFISLLDRINKTNDKNLYIDELFIFFSNVISFIQNSKSSSVKSISYDELNKIFDNVLFNANINYLYNNIISLISIKECNYHRMVKNNTIINSESYDLILILNFYFKDKYHIENLKLVKYSKKKTKLSIKKDYPKQYWNQIINGISSLITEDLDQRNQIIKLLEKHIN